MNDELRDAIDRLNKQLAGVGAVDVRSIEVLISAATTLLQAKGEMPQKISEDCVEDEMYNRGIDACLPIVAKMKAENKRLREALQPFLKYANSGYMKRSSNPIWIKECEQAKQALAKEG